MQQSIRRWAALTLATALVVSATLVLSKMAWRREREHQQAQAVIARQQARAVAARPSVTLVEELDDALGEERSVLLVSSQLSFGHIHCEHVFKDAAEHWRANASQHVRFVNLQFGYDTPGEQVWDSTMEWWKRHDLPQGGYKDWGCTGSIVWLRNGEPLQHRFCRGRESAQIVQLTRDTFGE